MHESTITATTEKLRIRPCCISPVLSVMQAEVHTGVRYQRGADRRYNLKVSLCKELQQSTFQEQDFIGMLAYGPRNVAVWMTLTNACQFLPTEVHVCVPYDCFQP